MAPDPIPTEWVDTHGTVAQPELARACTLSVAELEELVEYGLLRTLGGGPSAHLFSASWCDPLRRAAELRARFDLELFVVGLMAAQFEQIASLEQQLRHLRAHLPRLPAEREGPAPWHEPHG